MFRLCFAAGVKIFVETSDMARAVLYIRLILVFFPIDDTCSPVLLVMPLCFRCGAIIQRPEIPNKLIA